MPYDSVIMGPTEPTLISKPLQAMADSYIGSYDEKGQELINRYANIDDNTG